MTREEFDKCFIQDHYFIRCETVEERNMMVDLLVEYGFKHHPLSVEYVENNPTDTTYMHIGMDNDDEEGICFVLWSGRYIPSETTLSYEDAVSALTGVEDDDQPDEDFCDMLNTFMCAVL